jgi:hypothetical protein
MTDLPRFQPVSHKGRLFWVAPDGSTCYNEDGTVPDDGTIRFINNREGQRVPTFVSAAALVLLNGYSHSTSDDDEDE